ncbi:tRNA (guanine-N(7)-)-methyltransferase non-catalytic subunit wdr4-like [Notothenia coriiceps]|uniref:tRNA (Guanine-N(7)-)-methyltransferase non-catalytic subunit wdr4-like n=1 Tax=Notothenia coriiceps TaxID=8208 RepID=A0A6I9P439_9TELE|nr:PREDICTED: tRNA (guanine-N(7)-)-methyltransferase non-catalytic subunit wdr4-like [Notothenia coriiceps]
MAENVTSHRYVDPKGNSSFRACFLNSGYSFSTPHQNCVSGVLEYLIFRLLSEDTSMRSSCSLAGMLLLMHVTNGLRTQSSVDYLSISGKWVVRRCTSLLFNQAEDQLLATDKSGDVYSFSVGEPQREGELKMGHLSMLLAMFVLLPVRFVSALLVPPAYPHWLLSGSGDGTMKLWDYESGRKLQSWDLKEHEETSSSEADKQKKPTVCRISCSPDARHVAVQCERASTVHFFTVDQDGEEKLVPHRKLSLPHCPLDMTFDPEGQLWVLMDSSDAPLQIYTHRRDSWESDDESPELIRVTEAFKAHWETLEASLRTDSRFEHLYKVNFDNVAAYLQKKQQRLEEQLKRGGTQKANSNKKARKEKL